MTGEPRPAHPTSVAVWGAPSPVVAASRFTVTVGVKCSAACRLAGHPVVIRDGTGRDLDRGILGAEPAAGTSALYVAAVTLTAPREPGIHVWTAAFPAAAGPPPTATTAQPEPATATTALHHGAAPAPSDEGPSTSHERQEAGSAPPDEAAAAARPDAEAVPRHEAPSPEAASASPHEAASAPRHDAQVVPRHEAPPPPEAASAPQHEAASAPRHEAAACTFSFRTVERPGNAVTVAVFDRNTEAPLANADVHLGVHRASTDADGRARVEVTGGKYELYVRSPGYQPYAEPVTVTGDTALRVAAARVSDADLDDDQVWM